MTNKFEAAIDRIIKNGSSTQWIFTGKEDEDNKTLAKDIAIAYNTLHRQALLKAEKKAFKKGVDFEKERILKGLNIFND